MDEDFGAALDEGLDLGLPLFGAHKTRGGEHGEDFGRTAGGAQEFVEGTAGGNAFAAFAGEDDRAAFVDDAGGGAHAFDALVEVHVERITAVGGDDDIEGFLDFLHGGAADEFESGFVGDEEIASEDAGDGALFVQGNVEEEALADAQGDVANFFPDGIAIGDAKGGTGIADVMDAVIAHDGFERGATGHDAFGAAAEAGEEVGFDKASDDANVGFGEVTVDQSRGAIAGGAKLDHGAFVLGLVIDDAIIVDDFRGQEFFQFRVGVRTMRAQLIEQRNIFTRVIGEMFEQPGNNAIIRRGAGDVGKGDADAVSGTNPLLQRFCADGIGERGQHSAFFVGEAGIVRGFDDGGPVGQFDS